MLFFFFSPQNESPPSHTHTPLAYRPLKGKEVIFGLPKTESFAIHDIPLIRT